MNMRAENCLTEIQPVNPINQLLIDLFGNNYAPPYSTGNAPIQIKDLNEDKFLQWALPGGGRFKPPGEPFAHSISENLAAMTGIIGQFMTFLGPMFIIIDVIRGIIDVICALLNPAALISAIVNLLTTIIPPLISLLPPFAMVLMALNLCKLIITTVVSMLSTMIPIIDLILKNVASISELLASPNFNISAVDAVNTKVCRLFKTLDDQTAALAPLSFILDMFDLFSSLASSFFCGPGSACCDSSACPPFIVNPPTGTARVISKSEGFNLFGPEIANLLGLTASTTLEIRTAVSSTNSFGLVSSKGVGSAYTLSELLGGAKYVVDPFRLNGPSSPGPVSGPATPYSLAIETIRDGQTEVFTARIKKITTSPLSPTRAIIEIDRTDFDVGNTVRFTIKPDMTALLTANLIGLGCINEISVASQGLANQTNADTAATGLNGSPPVTSGLSSLRQKIGRDLPRLPIEDLQNFINIINADPTVDVTEDISNVLLNYVDDVTDYYDNVLCVGASRLRSEFNASKTTVIADGKDSVTLTLTIRDQGGAPLLLGLLPNSTASAEFYSTNGTIGPVIFDSVTSTYTATFTSTSLGEAEISAAFIINNNVCMTPGIFDGFTVSDKIITIKVLPIEETFNRRRSANQYVQSGRGKRR